MNRTGHSIIYSILSTINLILIYLLFMFIINKYLGSFFDFLNHTNLFVKIIIVVLAMAYYSIDKIMKELFSIIPKTYREFLNQRNIKLSNWVSLYIFLIGLSNVGYLIYNLTISIPHWNFWNIFFYVIFICIISISHVGVMPKVEELNPY